MIASILVLYSARYKVRKFDKIASSLAFRWARTEKRIVAKLLRQFKFFWLVDRKRKQGIVEAMWANGNINIEEYDIRIA